MRHDDGVFLVRKSSGVWLAVVAVAVSVGLAAPSRAVAPPQSLTAFTALPPGNLATVTAVGQVVGTATGKRADFGPHTDDQRAMYWNFQFKSSDFFRDGVPISPAPGVSIYRDSYGVPSVYGTTGRNVWFGAGYAAAADRLFLMDAVRRSAEGRLAELTGPSAVPGDVQQRVIGYTDAEYAAFYSSLDQATKDAFAGYTDGVNAYLNMLTLNPTLLPGEYALLSSVPEKWTIKDSLSAGVFMSRFVASEGGNEMKAVARLAALESTYGVSKGRGIFNDLYPIEDNKAITTVQAEDARFDDVDTPRSQRAAAFKHLADYAHQLPVGLADGPGTGGFPVPANVGAPGAGATMQARAAAALDDWRAHLHGGSYAIAVSGKKTANGKAMLESAPQLGWTAPSYLYEIEVHGGGYDARGVGVPGLPVMAIGYSSKVAWAWTTGYSKTIDSFIETTRTVNGKAQYLHNGTWKDQSCRNEVVSFRNAEQGAPVGPALRSVTIPVCRTVHGPVVATSGNYARSVQYAMWNHEVDNATAVLGFDRSKNLKDFAANVAKLSLNENMTAADSDGNIGYWHPGRYPTRAAGSDQRLPLPGTGAYDWKGWRPFAKMPHVVNPKQGFITNWNNKPAVGWTSGEAQSQVNSAGDRMGIVAALVRPQSHLTLTGLAGIDRSIGSSNARARILLKPLLAALKGQKLPAPQAAGFKALASWNGAAYGPGAGTANGTDSTAPTLFEIYIDSLRQRLGAGLPGDIFPTATRRNPNHIYDTQRLDQLAMRIVDPATTSLKTSRDWTGGLGAAGLQRKAFADAVAIAVKTYGPSAANWRHTHPLTNLCTLTKVIGPPCINEPFEDRGSWIQLISFH